MSDKKINHPELEMFFEYLDGELDVKTKSFEEHVNSCIKCQKKLHNLKVFYTDISNIPEEELDFDISSKVIETLYSSIPTNSLYGRTTFFQILTSLFIFISILVFGVPINSLPPIHWHELIGPLNFDWLINMDPKHIKLPPIELLTFQIPKVAIAPEVQMNIIIAIVIGSGILCFFANRHLIFSHNQANDLKPQNGG